MNHAPQLATAATNDPIGALVLATGSPPLRATDKSVREQTVLVKLKRGQVVVETKMAGVLFSFPFAVWPADSWTQAQWVERLTPWWDMTQPDWTPQAQRLRDSCRAAINKLSVLTQNLGNSTVESDDRKASGECVGTGSLSLANT